MREISNYPHFYIEKGYNNIKYIVDSDPNVFRETLSVFDSDFIYGQFAAVSKVGDNVYEAVRDPIGIHKMFYCRDVKGTLFFSRRFEDLFLYKSNIYSLPAGCKVRLDGEGIHLLGYFGPHIKENEALSADAFQQELSSVIDFRSQIESRLYMVFEELQKKEKEGWAIYLALSGGLDSTIMAKLATKTLTRPIACTLDLGKSEDSEKSKKIAAHLGIEHKVFEVNKNEIIDALDEAPSSCQDFRDFNVHCAALNILLARKIKSLIEDDPAVDPRRVIIVTGDLMNEFTCDYAGEVIDGKEYYKLPRVGKKRLQEYLVGGLDTSDREISPFASYGFVCIQPYAVLWDLYLSVHGSVLMSEDPKKLLNLYLVDEVIESFIPKIKLRAQVGSRENMGILGLCHNRGWDDKTFHAKLIASAPYPEGKVPIFVGRYDVEKFNDK